ncbi:MAG TPA: hypothetical protein VH092_07940, partial [Urbifossiella sp.]|nr:hypothetical protein [Urbifossiella sp.]
AFSATTDESGVVRFDGVPAMKFPGQRALEYEVRGYLAGRPPVDVGEAGFPPPNNRQLEGATAVVPELVVAAPDTERRVVLREQPVGYITARLRPPPGRRTGDYSVILDRRTEPFGGNLGQYRSRAGEFIAGPFAPGPMRLFVARNGSDARPYAWSESRDVMVTPGGVTRVELAPPEVEPPPPPGPSDFLVEPDGVYVKRGKAERLPVRVFLPGRREQAFGAVVLDMGWNERAPSHFALTDAAGQVHGRAAGGFEHPRPAVSSDDPPGRIVAALLPGTHGGTVATLPEHDQPLEIILPPAVSVRGRVTVGGVAPAGLAGTVRVLAAYEGKGKGRLGAVFSVETTAQTDGSFELAGLTPGRYVVQAALDDIWLSPSVALDVADRPLDPLVLAIPAPGGPVAVTVVGPDGTPRSGRAVTVDRPAGPLTARLWPAEWSTDGAGVAYIPALEVGRHTVRVRGTAVSAEVVAPGLSAGRAAGVRLTVEADAGR